MTVAENIKRLRKERGFTQKQLAEKCGMSESTLRQYEIGYRNPKIETLHRIAKALDKSIILLVEGCEDKYPLTNTDYQLDIYNSMTDEEKEISAIIDQAVWIAKSTDISNVRLNQFENKLLGNYRLLNEDGKKEANKRVEELTEISRYTKKEPSEE